ncbi:hypothetical protein VN12_08615 [Pirellula sp. SH-Sr6A]|nr:hypothetical protein VN12_08615 [Pirellula sp. SH-Sr6A]
MQAVGRSFAYFMESIGATASMLFLFGVSVSLSLFTGGNVSGADTDAGEVIQSIRSGLNGVWKVGYETVHRVELSSDRDLSVVLELDTVDGEGVGIRYRSADWKADLSAVQPITLSLYAKHGRAQRPIVVRVLDAQTGELIESRGLTDAERGVVLPAEQPWVVGIGTSGMKLDSAVLRSAKGILGDYTVTELDQAQWLPESGVAWDGVDLLVFSSSNRNLLDGIGESQASGVRDWVRGGGRCLLTLGANAEAWFLHPPLAQMVPGKLLEVTSQCNPGPLESYLNSEIPLQPFDSAILELNDAGLDLLGQKADRGRYPLLAKWAFGLGKVRLIATEIDSPSLLRWESQPAFIKWMLNDQWEGRGANAKSMVGAEDLSLQLGSTLDQFANLRMGNLTQMSVLLGLMLAVLGPIDFFLVAKRWKRPRWTWLTLIGTSVGCCLLLSVLQQRWKPSSPQLNAVELLDVDARTGVVMAKAYAHLYGGSRGVFSVEARANPKGLLHDPIRGGAAVPVSLVVDWMGQPGKSLGGFDSTVATDRILPSYEIVKRASVHGVVASSVQRLGLPEAGTKSLMASDEMPMPTDWQFGKLSSIPGAVDLLNGSIVNPLPCELRNGVLLYRGRFYSLPLRMRTGEGVSLSVSTIPKDFARRLQKRINVDGKDEGTPWDRNEIDDPKRLLEMLAFHRSAGGFGYTGMIHRYLSKLDLSELLRTERAILFAELPEPQVEWVPVRNSLQNDPNQAQGLGAELEGTRTAMIRIVIPVEQPSGSERNATSDDE